MTRNPFLSAILRRCVKQTAHALAIWFASLAVMTGAPSTPLPGVAPSDNEGQPIPLPSVEPDAKGNYPKPPEAMWPEDGRKGEFIRYVHRNSPIYPGTDNEITIYVPTAYKGDHPACLYVRICGFGDDPAVYENLITAGRLPVTILVSVGAGAIWKDAAKKEGYRLNRSYEFDSVNGNFADFLEKEILPEIESKVTKDGRPIRFSHEAKDRAIGGGSTCAVAAFTVAWQRPDLFSRVFAPIGTFVAMRGSDEYPALIRKTEPKPIRIFLEDGDQDAWNPVFGSWYLANINMDAAFRFAHYDEAHLWAHHIHDGRLAEYVLPSVMQWLWKDWPNPVKAGTSPNETLVRVLKPGESWSVVADKLDNAGGLAANARGEVTFAAGQSIFRFDRDDKPVVFCDHVGATRGQAFGPDGTLYATQPEKERIIGIDPSGTWREVVSHIQANSVLVTDTGKIFASEPGRHSDEPGSLWSVKPGGEKALLAQGISGLSGIAISPDQSLFVAAQSSTKWIYSFIPQPDDTLAYGQRYFWLHSADLPGNSETQDVCYDAAGDLFVATNLGIQICDRNGRVHAIVPLPPPSGPVRSCCFGGQNFDILYATDGVRIFKRRMAVKGHAAWEHLIPLGPNGGG